MRELRYKTILLCLLGIIILSTGCSMPAAEELKGGNTLHLAILPFKKDGKYIAFQLINSLESASLIQEIKRIKDLDDLDDIDDDLYDLINSIEQFDNIYRGGKKPYFILVKCFLQKQGGYKYIYTDFFDENNFGVI